MRINAIDCGLLAALVALCGVAAAEGSGLHLVAKSPAPTRVFAPTPAPEIRVSGKQLTAPGTLMYAPADGVQLSAAKLVRPDVMSITFLDYDVAYDFWQEANSNGEHVCLSVLPGELHGRRYWLRTC